MATADAALTRLEVDKIGLDAMDHKYLKIIAEMYAGGPVGIETLAAAMSEPRDALEDIVEPFLMQKGLVMRTSRGRVLAGAGFKHIGMAAPKGLETGQMDLIGDDEWIKL